eukprot:jgi/Picre1/32462/NNA_007808.t1
MGTVLSSVSSFDHASYFSLLKTRQAGLGRVLVTASDTLSTQASLQQRAGKVPHGTLFVSDRQTGGKGRGGNTWASPEGCLMCSMSIRYGGGGDVALCAVPGVACGRADCDEAW